MLKKLKEFKIDFVKILVFVHFLVLLSAIAVICCNQILYRIQINKIEIELREIRDKIYDKLLENDVIFTRKDMTIYERELRPRLTLKNNEIYLINFIVNDFNNLNSFDVFYDLDYFIDLFNLENYQDKIAIFGLYVPNSLKYFERIYVPGGKLEKIYTCDYLITNIQYAVDESNVYTFDLINDTIKIIN